MDKSVTQNNNEKENFDFEANQNLVGFFDLLLKVDMRVNPNLYKHEKIEQSIKEVKYD